MNIHATNLIRLLSASAAIVIGAVLLTFVVDPLQLFRPARLFVAMYSTDNRLQDAGLIRSQSFDTVLMGNSLAIHFRQSDIDRVLGVRSLKLSMTGSSAREQVFVLSSAMERRPKRVIWQMDDWIFRDATDIDADVYIPANLYRRNAKGIADYLLSGAMARESLWITLRSIPPLTSVVAALTRGMLFEFRLANVDDINVLRPDSDIGALYNAKKAMASFVRVTEPANARYLGEGYSYEFQVKNFEHDAIGLIERNPDVQFDIYFPPYSILQWVAMRDASPGTLKIVYDVTDHIARRLATFPNVRLFDFRAVSEITHDLSQYADVVHHSPVVDRRILSMLAKGEYLVDRDAPTASLEKLKAQVEAYRVER
jgi:hypothetical protein